MKQIDAQLKIPKGFRKVIKPDFSKVVMVLVCLSDGTDLYWKDATLELEDDENSLYIFIERGGAR